MLVRFFLSLFLQLVDNFSLGPAELLSELSEDGDLSEVLDSDRLEGVWHQHPLLLAVWVWHAFEGLQPPEGGGASGGLVREHASHGPPEDPRGVVVMDMAPSWVGSSGLAHEAAEPIHVSEHGSRDHHSLGPHDDDSFAEEQLFGDNRCESSQKVVFSVNNSGLV